jgi:hypothetical protein
MYKQRNRIMIEVFRLLVATALLAGLALGLSHVHAAAINVDGVTCTLADAITSANSDTATGGCSAGSGADTLYLGADVSLTSALPDITTQVTIEGGGHTIQRTGGPDFSVLQVTATGDLTLNQVTITGGTSNSGGGGGINNAGILTVQSSTLSGNGAAFLGGGLLNLSGAIATIQNSTISGNATGYLGGGIYNQGDLMVQNSIVALQLLGADCDNEGTITSNGYNIESGTTCGFTLGSGQQNVDSGTLNLGPLADNGGPTQTHALQYDSSAVEVIPRNTSGCGTDYTTDQRGEARPQGGLCDVGAYESPYIFWDGGGWGRYQHLHPC